MDSSLISTLTVSEPVTPAMLNGWGFLASLRQQAANILLKTNVATESPEEAAFLLLAMVDEDATGILACLADSEAVLEALRRLHEKIGLLLQD